MQLSEQSKMTKSTLMISFLLITLLAAPALQQCTDKAFTDLLGDDYWFKSHQVTTNDGYILNIFNIRSKEANSNQQVAFLAHGLEESADVYIFNGKTQSLALYLADLGYDVWLGNNRGNKYSIGHTTLKTNSAEFWDFSWQQMGEQDLPSMLLYVSNLLNLPPNSIHYLGHSQGTTQAFAAMSDQATQQLVQSLIRKFYALAPAVFMSDLKGSANLVASQMSTYKRVAYLVGDHQPLPPICDADGLLKSTISAACKVFSFVCNSVFMVASVNSTYDKTEKIPFYVRYLPCGSSFGSWEHYYQQSLYNKKEDVRGQNTILRKFDYGKRENMKRYQQEEPPMYDFGFIRTDIVLFVGEDDNLGTKLDCQNLEALLKTNEDASVKTYLYKNWGHLTPIIGRNVAQYFEDIKNEMQSP